MSHHARSISVPTNSHPFALRVEEQLCQLRSSELATTSSSSSSSIFQNLLALQVLYVSVDDLLQLPLAHQSQSFKRQGSPIDQLLDGSVKLLDICGNTKDVLSQVKESLQDLQSSLRRRGNDGNEVCAYTSSRKKGNKSIHKCLSDIKKMEKQSSLPSFDVSDRDMVCILREVETITIAVFRSLISFVSMDKSKQSNWSLVSKLKTLIGQNSCKSLNILDVQKPLEALEMSIQGFEDELECLFRRLIKIRVSVLNIANQ